MLHFTPTPRWPGKIRALLSFSLVAFATFARAQSGFAAEGILEINHTCATRTGCFAADTPGYPVTIATLGSYRLTSNLTVPDANTTAISITGHDVSIDFAGFSIIGPGEPGSGYGVESVLALRMRISGGSVIGVGDIGIEAGTGSIVTGMLIENSGGIGIVGWSSSIVSRNRVIGAGDVGITSKANTIVRENTIVGAASLGVSAGNLSLVLRNVVRNSGSYAIASPFPAFNDFAYGNNLLTNNNGGSGNPQVDPTQVDAFNLGGNVCGTSQAACP